MTTILTSSADPTVSIRLSDEVRQHLMAHFDPALPGSKFLTPNPETLLQHLLDSHPETFRQAVADPDGRKRLSIALDGSIGTCNVVPLGELTAAERATLQRVQRGDKAVRVATSSRTFPTCECQLVLSATNDLITLYPGQAAPPLPPTPDTPDPYWDHHVFIAPDNPG
ncbi:MAG: hypothetical protein IJ785_06135 [Bacteroidales bacterium]|nr:hypothetical protein [Bacteroidales bacterium]